MQILIQVTFFVISALILGSAIMVVSSKDIIHSALWLIASFFGVGALYMLMEAEFIAIVQVLVYVGAISVLVMFAIMLTRHLNVKQERRLYSQWWIGLLVSAGLFGGVLVPLFLKHSWGTPTTGATAEEPTTIAGAVELGKAFMGEYLLPFEVASVVLLVALIGAIVIAFEERSQRRRVLTLAEEVALKKQQEEES